MMSSNRLAENNGRGRTRRAVRGWVICAIGFALVATAAGATPPKGDEGKRPAAPVVRKSEVSGVGLIVEMPERMHPVTRARIDSQGKVRLGRGPQRDAADAPNAK